MAKIVYFVHDLTDPAVRRRARMFVSGGADVILLGFRRTADPVEDIVGIQPIDLGQTFDDQIRRRVAKLASTLFNINDIVPTLVGADAIVARNLEMLFLAILARSIAGTKQPVTYECLDIHRLQVSRTLTGSAIRRIESWLLRRSRRLMTSSPAFVSNYFGKLSGDDVSIHIVENKVFDFENTFGALGAKRQVGPPWVIGWYGALRCTRSLTALTRLAEKFSGEVKIVTAGRPAGAVFENFEASICDQQYISFLGPYRNPEDLSRLYNVVHFSWSIDYFDENSNSSWLLPNRMYEGGLYGAVPIALKNTETGRWLNSKGLGVVLDEPLDRTLEDYFTNLTGENYLQRLSSMESSPRDFWLCDIEQCRELVETVCR